MNQFFRTAIIPILSYITLEVFCVAELPSSPQQIADLAEDKGMEQFEALFLDEIAAWKKNSQCTCDVRKWSLHGADAESKANAIEQLVKKVSHNNAPDSFQTAELNFQSFVKEIEEKLGHTSVEQWDITIFGDTRKFRMTYDKETFDYLNEKHVHINAPRQWLYSTNTVYEYSEAEKVLRVHPLNPFTEAYPFRMDIMNFFMALTNTPKEFLSNLEVDEWKNNSIEVSTSKTKALKLHIKLFQAICEISSMKLRVNQDNEIDRYYIHQIKAEKVPGISIPLSVVEIHRHGGGTEITLMSIRSVEFDKISQDDIALKISESAQVVDDSQPFLIKKK